jgi:hypothetical protein
MGWGARQWLDAYGDEDEGDDGQEAGDDAALRHQLPPLPPLLPQMKLSELLFL